MYFYPQTRRLLYDLKTTWVGLDESRIDPLMPDKRFSILFFGLSGITPDLI